MALAGAGADHSFPAQQLLASSPSSSCQQTIPEYVREVTRTLRFEAYIAYGTYNGTN